jgi:SWI/SNF-related matrix-associated actin-dependent regulator 1 of chromatin subfamily A
MAETPHEIDIWLNDALRTWLKTYQKDAVAQAMKMKFRVLNALACGSGKTGVGFAQHVCSLNLYVDEQTRRQRMMQQGTALEDLPPPTWTYPLPMLIICPASKIVEFKRDCIKLLQMDESELCVLKDWNQTRTGQQRRKRKRAAEQGGDAAAAAAAAATAAPEWNLIDSKLEELKNKSIFLVSYAGCSTYLSLLCALHIRTLLMDESQMVKNMNSKMAKSISALVTPDLAYCICNSANPIAKYPIDMFPQLHFLRPDLFPSWLDFAREHCRRIDRTVRVKGGYEKTFFEYKEIKNLEKWDAMLSEVMVQVTAEEIKQESADRPETTHTFPTLVCSKDEDREKVKSFRAEYKQKVEDSTDECLWKIYGEMCQKMLKYKIKQTTRWLKRFLHKTFQDDPTNRVLIFLHHKRFFAAVTALLDTLQVTYIRVDGETVNRQKEFDRFQAGQVQVALLSLKACSHGVNLFQGNIVVFGEWPPNASDCQQGVARADRMGQTRQVHVHYLILKDSSDEDMLKRIQRKMRAAAPLLKSTRAFEEQFSKGLKRKQMSS